MTLYLKDLPEDVQERIKGMVVPKVRAPTKKEKEVTNQEVTTQVEAPVKKNFNFWKKSSIMGRKILNVLVYLFYGVVMFVIFFLVVAVDLDRITREK